MYKNSQQTFNGTLNLYSMPAGNAYKVVVTTTDVNTVNACISVNYSVCSTTSGYFASKNSYPCTLSITTTNNATCSASTQIELKLQNYYSQTIDTIIRAILIINPSITGNINFCGATTNTFTGSVGSATVSINKSGWKVNGQTPPVTTSNSSFTVTSPGGNDKNVTLTYTSTSACSPISMNLYTNNANAPQPSLLSYNLYMDCIYSLTTNNYNTIVYQYEWSDNAQFNDRITTTTYTTGLNWEELTPCTVLTVYIRTINACNTSAPLIRNISLPTQACCQMTGCCGYGDQMNGEGKEFSVIYYRETKQVHIEYNGEKEFAKADIIVMSAQGRITEKYQMNERTIDLTDNCLVNGLNLIKVETSDKCHSFKLIK